MKSNKPYTYNLHNSDLTPTTRAFILRLLELAGIAPHTVASNGIRISKNHIEYNEFVLHGNPPHKTLNHSDGFYIKKRRIVRNPLRRTRPTAHKHSTTTTWHLLSDTAGTTK